ncbi:MAG TPA: alpha/beta hydrolase-fold protein [Kofleriaceae bacterium]
MTRISPLVLLLAVTACKDTAKTPAPAPTPVATQTPEQKVPAEVPAPEAAKAENPAKITIQSKVMGEERTILVRTPPGYEAGSGKYPVLYMTDGDRNIGHTAATAEFLAQNGRAPEMIVVGISNTDRTRDLTPSRASFNEAGREIPFPTSGGADKFLDFIEKEVIPLVESKYRVQPYRVFAGHSFGGLFAIHAFSTRPELFNAYIAVAPSLQWDKEMVVKKTAALVKERPELARTVYVSLGNEPGASTDAFKHLQGILGKSKVKGLEFGSDLMLDEDHGSIVMRAHDRGLRKVFAGWQLPRGKDGSVAGGLPGAEKHFTALSQRLGYEVKVPEAIVNQIGYELLLAPEKKVAEAIEVFKVNVERYPDSANVHDSLGEAYEAAGKLDLARAGYQKAIEIGTEKKDPNLAAFKDHLTALDKKKDAGKQASAGTN